MSVWTVVAVLIVAATCLVFDKTHAFYKFSSVGGRYFSEGRYTSALPYLLAAYRTNPQDKTVTWKLVWTYQHLGREGEARRLLQEIDSKSPADPKESESLGDLAYSTKAYAMAQRYYERVLIKQPSTVVRKKYVDTLLAQKKYEDAINQMGILLSGSPNDPDLRFQHAQVIAATGDHERAVRELQALLDDGFTKKEAKIMLADELRALGHDEEAIKVYQGVTDEK